MQVIPVFNNPSSTQLNVKEATLAQAGEQLNKQSFEHALQTHHQSGEEEASGDSNVVTIPIQEEQNILFNILQSGQSPELQTTEGLLSMLEVEKGISEASIEELALTQAPLTDDEVDVKNINFEQEVIPLIQTIKTLLPVEEHGGNIKEIATRLVPILQKWTSLNQKVDEEKLKPVLEEQLSKEQLSILKFLESNVDKRNLYANQYRQDASITRTDMMNWLQVAVERYSKQQERVITPHVSHEQVLPMSKVEQHTIHIQSLDRVDRVSEELTQKLVTIIKESRFLTKPNNLQQMNQLTVVLRPEHLGNITVRFQQVDGNMTVNMIVTSQATKELLEANMHQLKHMFSPHQVVIERDVTTSDEEFFKEKQEKEEQDDHETLDQSNESKNNRNEEDELDFQSFIEQFTKGGLQND